MAFGNFEIGGVDLSETTRDAPASLDIDASSRLLKYRVAKDLHLFVTVDLREVL
jgi:hypothetical protein